MKIRIGKDINWLIGVGIINLIAGMFCYLATMHTTIRLILFPVFLVCYIFIYTMQKDDEKKAYFLILSIWQFTLMLEVIYRLVRYSKTPFEFLNIFDIIALIFLFEMIFRKKLTLKRDVIWGWFVTFAVYGIIITWINGSNLIDCLTALKIMFRFFGVYLYFSSNTVNFPSWSSYIAPVAIIALVVEVFLNVNVDFRNGIFGYQYTSEMFPLVLIISVTPILIEGYKKLNHVVGMIVAFCGVEICFALMEAKAEIIIFVVWLIIIFVIVRAKDALIKRTLIIIGVMGGLMTFWRVMIKLNTKFERLNITLWDNLYSRVLKASKINYLGTKIVENAEVTNEWQRVFGVGMGASLPPLNLRWVIQSGETVGDLKSIFKASEIYQKYPGVLEFFSNSYNTTKLDLGIVGVLLIVVLFSVLFYRSYVLCRKSNLKEDNVLGAIGIWQVIILFYRSYSSSIMLVPISMVVTFALFGMVSYRYKNIKKKSS